MGGCIARTRMRIESQESGGRRKSLDPAIHQTQGGCSCDHVTDGTASRVRSRYCVCMRWFLSKERNEW